jgi:hypothetical protein
VPQFVELPLNLPHRRDGGSSADPGFTQPRRPVPPTVADGPAVVSGRMSARPPVQWFARNGLAG